MTHSYKLLLKDKEIIAAEVMNEYNQVVRAMFVLVFIQRLTLPCSS